MLTGEIKGLYADLVSLRITTGLFKSTGKCISFTAWAESCFFHSTCKHESKQGIISGMHFKDLTESYAQKQTQHRSGHCWQNILHFVLKFTSGTASLRGIWKKKWSSLGISQQITTIFYCSCLHNRSAYKSKPSGLLPSMTMHLTSWRLSEKKHMKNEVKGGMTTNRQTWATFSKQLCSL